MADSYSAGQSCRVTVVAGERRRDVGLPTDIALAELLPALLAGAQLPDRGAAGWTLRRLAGPPLDTGLTAADLALRHGEVLYLRPSPDAGPVLRVDDVIDAVGAAARDLPGRWSAQAARPVALVALGAALAGGAAALVLAAGSGPAVVGAALGAGLILLLAAGLVDRALEAGALGPVLGIAAVGYAVVAGVTAISGPGAAAGQAPGLGGWAVGCAAALPACAAGAVLAPSGRSWFAAVALAGLLGLAGITGATALAAPPAGAAALALALAVLIAPAFGPFALRWSGLPLPFIPLDRSELAEGGTELSARQIAAGTARADHLLSALVAGSAVVTVIAGLVLWSQPGTMATALTGAAAIALLLRGRHHRSLTARLWLYGASLTLAALPAAHFIVHSGPSGRIGVSGALLLAALGAAAVGAAEPGHRVSPTLGRWTDLVEVLAVIAVLPLALSVLGVYALVRQLGG